MKKILTTMVFSISFLLAGTSFKEFKPQITSDNLYKSEILKNMEEDLFINKNEKRKIINKYMHDENFQKGIYVYYMKKMKKSIGDKEVTMPKYIDVLDFFEASTRKNNVLASYAGFVILEKYFLLNGNQIGKEYLNKIIKPLANEKNPTGLYWYGKSFMQEWSKNDKPNYPRAIESFELAIQEIDKLLKDDRYENNEKLKNLRIFAEKEKIKAKSVKFLRDERAKGNYHRVKRDLLKLKREREAKKREK